MGKLLFILGGIKSGKSSFAVELLKNKKDVFFIATGSEEDEEMKEKILKHKQTRPKHFITIEEKINIVKKIKNLKKTSHLIIDCINFWVANMLKVYDEKEILLKTKDLCKNLKKFKISVVVSNEVGLSLVATNNLARKFQDILGKVNQIFTKYADKVFFMMSGIPLRIK